MSSSFPLVALMWFGMMAAMMFPVSVPWVRVLISLHDGSGRVRAGALFLVGYLSAWLLFSLAAAAVQLSMAGMVPPARDAPAAGFLLVGAGLYQLSPAKAACLRHCRNPLSFFLARWRDGPRGILGMGWRHGLHCLGCCWALMALALVLGVMNPLWMTVLTGVVCIENLAPGGPALGRVAGMGLVVWGVAVWAGG